MISNFIWKNGYAFSVIGFTCGYIMYITYFYSVGTYLNPTKWYV